MEMAKECWGICCILQQVHKHGGAGHILQQVHKHGQKRVEMAKECWGICCILQQVHKHGGAGHILQQVHKHGGAGTVLLLVYRCVCMEGASVPIAVICTRVCSSVSGVLQVCVCIEQASV